jgi:glycosyltransferase involved in cell wall biosynthesis
MGHVSVCMYSAESQKGHARYTRDLLSALVASGRESGVSLALVTSQDLAPPYRTSLYPIHPILPPLVHRGAYRRTPAWGISRVAHYLRRERTFLDWVAGQTDLDVIHFQEYTPWLAPWHYRDLRRRGLAIVATVHNVKRCDCSIQLYGSLGRLCWKSAWRACSALLVHTEGLRTALAEFLGKGHPPIYVTPHGVWQERCRPPCVAPPREGRCGRLLFFGMIHPNKGLHFLLQAMGRLPHCHLTIAGHAEEPDYLDQIRGLARCLPPDRVALIDRFIDEAEIADLFDQCHLVVLPYRSFAAQSGVLHQALAHGRPVVATDVGALGESVRAWGVGLVVPPNDERALAEAIERALEPEPYRAAVEAIARIRAELTWTRMAEATIDVYHAVAS